MYIMQSQNFVRVHQGIRLFVGLVFAILVFHTSVVHAQAQARLLVMGDSLSAAYGMASAQGWVALLQQTLDAREAGVQVVNASISGETTSGGLQRLPALLNRHQPQFVVIELGANDALRGQNLRASERNLAKMIALSQAQGAQVMLLGIRLPTNYGPAYDAQLAQVYAGLAARYDVLFDPFFLATVALEPDLMQDDALHPNSEAQAVILQRLLPLFNQWFSEPK